MSFVLSWYRPCMNPYEHASNRTSTTYDNSRDRSETNTPDSDGCGDRVLALVYIVENDLVKTLHTNELSKAHKEDQLAR